jgi:glycosyltransferase involved in cell wall biosynthesis
MLNKSQSGNVTACILSFNRPAYLCAALESVLAQTKMPTSIYIFDNGSDSMVRTAVAKYIENGVRWVGSDINRSLFWNFRRAIMGVDSEYVFVLHDDDRLCSTYIEKQLNFLQSAPEVGAVTCNGFLIDENGIRSGQRLRTDFGETKVEFYRTGVDMAMLYASDRCFPMSPVMYRTAIAKKTELRDEFEKVRDAVFYCDLADSGVVAYQADTLYEYRFHSGQDSSYFPSELLQKLEDFFWTRSGDRDEKIEYMHLLLVRQHTTRIVREIFYAFRRLQSSALIFSALGRVKEDRFSLLEAFRFCAGTLVKKGARMIRKTPSNTA